MKKSTKIFLALTFWTWGPIAFFLFTSFVMLYAFPRSIIDNEYKIPFIEA